MKTTSTEKITQSTVRKFLFISAVTVLMMGYQNCSKQEFAKYSAKSMTDLEGDLNNPLNNEGGEQNNAEESGGGITNNTGVTNSNNTNLNDVVSTQPTMNQISNSVILPTKDGGKELSLGTVALSGQMKASKMTTIAFEDLPLNQGSDLDFNDFVFNFNVIEKLNSQQELTEVQIIYEPKIKESGNDHQLLLFLKGGLESKDKNNLPVISESNPAFVGDFDVLLTYEYKNKTKKDIGILNGPDQINIFTSTKQAFSNVSKVIVKVKLLHPNLNVKNPAEGIDLKKYRTILQVPVKIGKSTVQKYLDVLDMNVDSINSDATQPFGLFVPGDWVPVEGQSVFNNYPSFKDHVNYLKDTDADVDEISSQWFLYPKKNKKQ